jgi:hypothetical protein
LPARDEATAHAGTGTRPRRSSLSPDQGPASYYFVPQQVDVLSAPPEFSALWPPPLVIVKLAHWVSEFCGGPFAVATIVYELGVGTASTML